MNYSFLQVHTQEWVAGSYGNSIFSWRRLTPVIRRASGTPLQVTHSQDVPLSGREQAVPVTKLHCVSTSNSPFKVGFVLWGWCHSWSTESPGRLCPGGGVSPGGILSPSFQSLVVVVETQPEPRTPSLITKLERLQFSSHQFTVAFIFWAVSDLLSVWPHLNPEGWSSEYAPL